MSKTIRSKAWRRQKITTAYGDLWPKGRSKHKLPKRPDEFCCWHCDECNTKVKHSDLKRMRNTVDEQLAE